MCIKVISNMIISNMVITSIIITDNKTHNHVEEEQFQSWMKSCEGFFVEASDTTSTSEAPRLSIF